MGTLYWQLNDCWPAASWSSIDYYTSWKALHYFARKAYQPVILAFIPDDEKIIISVCSDSEQEQTVQLSYAIKNFKGEVLEEHTIDTELNPERSVIAATIDKKTMARNYNTKEIFLEARLADSKKVIARELYFADVPKNLHLPEVTLESTIQKSGDELSVELASDKLARNVYLYFEGCNTQFSDNYFDLLPGEKTTVSCKISEEIKVEEKELLIISLNDILNP